MNEISLDLVSSDSLKKVQKYHIMAI